MVISGKRVQSRGNSKYKGPRAAGCLVCSKSRKQVSVTGGEWSERQGRGRLSGAYRPLLGPCLLLWLTWEPRQGVEHWRDVI